eukprot:gene19212-25063_t
MNNLINIVRKNGGKKIGSLFKNQYEGTFIPVWLQLIDSNQLEKVEISSPIGQLLAVKDETELELCKRAGVLTNKVIKHGFINEMENIIDKDEKVSHSDLATKIEGIITDPSKINLKVSSEVVESCYNPIIQSGGKYDIRISAVSNSDILSSDVIICSIGARYKSYCANVARTFLIDAPIKIEQTYNTLLSLYNKSLEAMVVGNELKDVYETAVSFLTTKSSDLLPHLPKTLGFAIGIEFRDGTLVLNGNNKVKFTENMVFTLSIGFQNVPLSDEDKETSLSESIKKLNVFSLLLSDTVRIMKEGAPDILTKVSKEYSDISYNISDKDDSGGKDKSKEEENAIAIRSTRLRENNTTESTNADRLKRQKEIIDKKLAESRLRAEKGFAGKAEVDIVSVEAKDIQCYSSPNDYPHDIVSNQVKIDMDKEVLFIPINGYAVPFHISTVKSVVLPGDVKNTSYLRINFFVPGATISKDTPKNMQLLVSKYGAVLPFIKEITLRSFNSKHFNDIHIKYQELKKRIRQRELKIEQEKDLVQQAKLIKIKDQKVPRLQDVRLFPQLSGQKCIGTVEAHQNGIRFTSTKGEVLDVLYSNIKHIVYQPCDKTTIVLLHFHLKDFIMIGKKKQKDLQFFTEVIDNSLNLDAARRFSTDVDELDEEQREREMRRRLNLAFKEFSMKLEKVAEYYDHRLTIDVPYKKVGFFGNPNREMVYIQPTPNCLINLTERPTFLISLGDVEHVHFERVTFGTKNFDLTFIYRNWDIKPRTITSIDLKSKEVIQDWLNLVEIPHTIGTRTMNWVETMNIAKMSGARFYENTDEDGIKKPPGWTFLSAEDIDNDEDDEEEDAEESDSEYSGESEESEEDESEEGSDSSFAEEDDESEFEEDDDEDEEDEVEEVEEIKTKNNTSSKRPLDGKSQATNSIKKFKR